MAFQILRTGEEKLDRVQDNIAREFQAMAKKVGLTVVPLSGIVISGSSVDNVVNHKLGRKIQGYIITRKNAESDVWESDTENKKLDRQIILKATNTVTVDLWVF